MIPFHIWLIAWLLSLVPYALVSWGYMVLVDGHAKDFWLAMGALLVARLFFGLIEWLGGLTWRVIGKRERVRRYLTAMRQQNFPKRRYSHYSFEHQLQEIEEEGSDFPPAVQRMATLWRHILEAGGATGILAGMRVRAAADAAYDLYSPKDEAPECELFKATETEN